MCSNSFSLIVVDKSFNIICIPYNLIISFEQIGSILVHKLSKTVSLYKSLKQSTHFVYANKIWQNKVINNTTKYVKFHNVQT